MRRQLVIAFMVTRLGLLAVALAAVSWLPGITGPEYRHVSTNPLIDVWHRWDSGFFTQIALHGYGWQAGQPGGDVTFLPLYPLLIGLPLRLMADPTQADAAVVGVLLSNVCLFVALLYLDQLLALDFDDLNLRRWVGWLFLLAPATIFFSSVYTESLFFMLSLIAIYHARRGQWIMAGLAGFLGAMTRVMGWTLLLPLVWEAWQQRGRLPRVTLGVASFAPALALPLYVGVVGLAMGAPDAYFTISASVWKQGWNWPWQTFINFFSGSITLYGWDRSWIDLAFTLGFFMLAILAFRVRKSYGLYAAAAIVFPVFSGILISMPRYVAVAFPVYIVLAQWACGHRWRIIMLLASSALLAAFFAARFVTWHWIA